MTTDEAVAVLSMMMTADGGCHICACDLAEKFIETFPEHTDLAVKAMVKEHGLNPITGKWADDDERKKAGWEPDA